MSQATHAAFDAQIGFDENLEAQAQRSVAPSRGGARFSVHRDIAAIEREWRAFESTAEGTVFQSFDWLSLWQRHIGERNGVRPAIVVGRGRDGRALFLLPLAVVRDGMARRLTWLGTELCDYNGPLLARDFAERIDAASFAALWHEIVDDLRARSGLEFDLVHFDKMQEVIGGQPNPFMEFGVTPHANGAYLTHLYGDWDKFYTDKRSSATRRRDRTKRKKLADFGEVKFSTPTTGESIAATLNTLMQQKSKSFAAMGVTNIFGLPGYREFYHALAAQPSFVHVSRLDVGSQMAAGNLALIFGDSYYHLLASYDGGELSKYGPGAAHMHDLMRYAIERGCQAFDFTIGDERYKQEWSDKKIVLFDHVEAVTPRGLPAAIKLAAVGRAKHLIKQTPALWEMAYKIRAFIGPIKKKLRG